MAGGRELMDIEAGASESSEGGSEMESDGESSAMLQFIDDDGDYSQGGIGYGLPGPSRAPSPNGGQVSGGGGRVAEVPPRAPSAPAHLGGEEGEENEPDGFYLFHGACPPSLHVMRSTLVGAKAITAEVQKLLGGGDADGIAKAVTAAYEELAASEGLEHTAHGLCSARDPSEEFYRRMAWLADFSSALVSVARGASAASAQISDAAHRGMQQAVREVMIAQKTLWLYCAPLSAVHEVAGSWLREMEGVQPGLGLDKKSAAWRSLASYVRDGGYVVMTADKEGGFALGRETEVRVFQKKRHGGHDLHYAEHVTDMPAFVADFCKRMRDGYDPVGTWIEKDMGIQKHLVQQLGSMPEERECPPPAPTGPTVPRCFYSQWIRGKVPSPNSDRPTAVMKMDLPKSHQFSFDNGILRLDRRVRFHRFPLSPEARRDIGSTMSCNWIRMEFRESLMDLMTPRLLDCCMDTPDASYEAWRAPEVLEEVFRHPIVSQYRDVILALPLSQGWDSEKTSTHLGINWGRMLLAPMVPMEVYAGGQYRFVREAKSEIMTQIWGQAGCGKSTAIDMLGALLNQRSGGEVAMSPLLSTSAQKEDTFGLWQWSKPLYTAVVCHDISRQMRLDAGALKCLISNERQEIPRKNRETFVGSMNLNLLFAVSTGSGPAPAARASATASTPHV